MNYNQKIGDLGQKIAKNYLMKRGHTIVDENVHFRCGEIDIIAKKNGILYFVEVKTRTSTKFGYPEDSISNNKVLKIESSIYSYMELNKLKDPYFVLIICVLIDMRRGLSRVYCFNV
jgi:putative endonuclease